jgi:3-deoxy-D-manno-octulosonate 8-phosphate phosphatase (KDO 8-P phosphatase)
LNRPSEVILQKARKVRMLLLDVDGILTDGRILYNEQGQEIKFFHVQDGQGIRWLLKAGITVGFLSGRSSPAVAVRARELKIPLLFQGIKDKILIFNDLLEKSALSREEVAYGGDDFIDLRLLKAVGFSFSVRDAHARIQKEVDYVTQNAGGYGAVREICELILEARDLWNSLLEQYGFQRPATAASPSSKDSIDPR